MLGKNVRDIITGACGTCTGRAEYLHGGTRCLVEFPVGAGGKQEDSQWIDEARLCEIGTPAVDEGEGSAQHQVCDLQNKLWEKLRDNAELRNTLRTYKSAATACVKDGEFGL